jgi:hypothetical protein
MTDAVSLARSILAMPPVHDAGATGLQIAETIHPFNQHVVI